jgi:hypothetical protein
MSIWVHPILLKKKRVLSLFAVSIGLKDSIKWCRDSNNAVYIEVRLKATVFASSAVIIELFQDSEVMRVVDGQGQVGHNLLQNNALGVSDAMTVV